MAGNNQPTKDFKRRYDAAKRYREEAKPRIQEILSFICPGREKDFDRTPGQEGIDEPETFVSLPEELATDFASDLVTYYCPAESVWTEYLVTAPVPQDAADQVKAVVTEREEDLFDMIVASNWNDVAPRIMFEGAHGTIAAWVEPGTIGQPVYVEPVPPHELLVTPGHKGRLDRFREKSVRADTLEALFNGWDVDLSDQAIKRKIEKDQFVKVCWGFWLDWSDPVQPLWRCEITVDGCRITPADDPLTLGPEAGYCPLLVGRFNPQTNTPWGRGPAWKALPEMRVINAVDEAVLDGLDQALRNTIIYPDDGFLNLSEGLEVGAAYAASRGFTRDQIYEMARDVNLDMGTISIDRLEDRLRGSFYQDGPRQRGDTPPTASQWLDERRRVQQRIGKPSSPLWTEFFLPLVQRLEIIGTEAGVFDGPLSLNGDVIAVTPISPLQKAMNQDKLLVSRSNLDMAMAAFGEALPQVIDMAATLQNHIDTSGDELTVIATQEAPTNGTAPPTE